MKRSLLFILLCSLFTFAFSKENTVVVFPNEVHQTIHSFGASDCWRTQYIGKNWPLE
ncbi:glycoside hydrolase, partial [Coprobacter fastidiosus]